MQLLLFTHWPTPASGPPSVLCWPGGCGQAWSRTWLAASSVSGPRLPAIATVRVPPGLGEPSSKIQGELQPPHSGGLLILLAGSFPAGEHQH